KLYDLPRADSWVELRPVLLPMRPLAFALVFAAALSVTVDAQPPVAPTGEPTQNPAGEGVPGYNILQSFEVGGRCATTCGHEGSYRGPLSYRDGFRLLSCSRSVQSVDGPGRFSDQGSFNSAGLGSDPYESAV